LWGIGFGKGNAQLRTNTLYFTAGSNDEADGLFGSIQFSDGSTAALPAAITNRSLLAQSDDPGAATDVIG
jgi:hypothetical protein